MSARQNLRRHADESEFGSSITHAALASRQKHINNGGRMASQVPVRKGREAAHHVVLPLQPVSHHSQLASRRCTSRWVYDVGSAFEAMKPFLVGEALQQWSGRVRLEPLEELLVTANEDRGASRSLEGLEQRNRLWSEPGSYFTHNVV